MNKPVVSDGTVGKALEVLEQVSNFGRPVRFTEVLDQSTHPKATLYRLVQTLVSQGMLNYDDSSQTYSMGLKLVRLAHSAWQQASLAPIASPVLDQLAQETQETIHLAQLESEQVLFVDKKRTTDRFETLAQTGRVAPCHCTGVGKAMLAHLPDERLAKAIQKQSFEAFTPNTHTNADSLRSELDEIRKSGVAFDREEHEIGIISIAAPILDSAGYPMGAMSIATSKSRRSLEELSEFEFNLKNATQKIAQTAEAWNFPRTVR